MEAVNNGRNHLKECNSYKLTIFDLILYFLFCIVLFY